MGLSNAVHNHDNDNQQAGANKTEWCTRLGHQKIRNDTNGGQIKGADDRQASMDEIEIVRRRLAGSEPGNKCAMLAQVIR